MLHPPRVLCSSTPAKQHSLKGLFFWFSPRKNPTEFYAAIISLHGSLFPKSVAPVFLSLLSKINQGSPLPREAASVTTKTILLGMAALQVDIICCHQQLKNEESQPLSHTASKSTLKTSLFIFQMFSKIC